jgi:hypothetical protein
VKTYNELAPFQELLHEDLIALLQVLWDLVLKGNDHQGRRLEYTMALVKHILANFPKKRVYRQDVLITTPSTDKIDIFDVLFNFIELFLSSYELEQDIVTHLKLVRALFFYQAKRVKDREERTPAIICAFKVLITRTVEIAAAPNGLLAVNTQIDSTDPDSIYDRLKRQPYEYLKAITHINESAVYESTSRREQYSLINRWVNEHKSIQVPPGSQHLLYTTESVPRVSITKL